MTNPREEVSLHRFAKKKGAPTHFEDWRGYIESGLLIYAVTKCLSGTLMEENKQEEHFFRCPFCSCVFLTKADLEKHMKAFGTQKERHLDQFRRCHSRAEYTSEE